MKRKIDIDSWERKELFLFFRDFEEPYYGITADLECTGAYRYARSNGISFFLYYLYLVLKAVNATDAFKYRIEGEDLYHYEVIDGSATVDRPDGTFGFSFMPYTERLETFLDQAAREMERVRSERRLISNEFGQNIIHFSALPWIRFSSVSHPRHFGNRDSIPKITVGKYYQEGDGMFMPVSVHVHHALADGLHVGQFLQILQRLFTEQNG
jgi:chloramphenicol O-acetyltransferase type A